MAGQSGFTTVGLLIGGAIVIVVAVFFVMQGLPVIVTQTANTTAMTAAGMDATQIQWWKWGLWGMILIVIVSIGGVLIKQYSQIGGGISGGGGKGGGGKGGDHRRRRR